MYILVEVVAREIDVTEFKTYGEAHKYMINQFKELTQLENRWNEDYIAEFNENLKNKNYFEGKDCGIYWDSSWINSIPGTYENYDAQIIEIELDEIL